MKRFAVITAFTSLLALPAVALDLETMSDAERQIFRAEVRAYLLDNPEVLMEAIAVLESRQSEQKLVDDTTLIQVNAEALFNDGNSFVGGNPDGDVVMVEFLDYRCGYCKRAHPEVTKLINTDGNIRYIIKEFPILGDQSVLASRFAISTKLVAGDKAYAKVHDALMTLRGEITDKSLRRLAGQLDLETDTIMQGMDSEQVSAVIAANHALGQIMQINGTPSFIMGDQMMRGYVPYDAMMQIVADLRS